MSIGNFRHAPNWDMVLYLQQIWPLIRAQLPDAELHIYGAYAPPKASALNRPDSGFIIKGRADNVYNTMEAYRVCLSPIRFGAGIKGKLLDAMVTQTPSVTTSVGSEGMFDSAADTWPGKVEDDMADFVQAAVNLYAQQDSWLTAQNHAAELLNNRYDAKVLGAGLIEKILDVSGQLEQHRLNNFSGAMLKHHSMASTKYMSQWIAEKNRHRSDNE
jgi:glycosyltransferase involved in cell wall biosynthesis